jgi:hypothetical protein
MNNHYSNKKIEWIWSNGEKPIKSQREQKPNTNEMGSMNQFKEEYVKSQCLYGEDTFIDINQQSLMTEFQRQPNKREDTYTRMAEREMVCQRGMNPFLSNNNNDYMTDLMNQETYLKPKSTHIETIDK